MRKRVVAYVTRERDGVKEVLVFDDHDHPRTGTQLPAGRLEPAETLEQGLLRELHEEAGIERARIVRELDRPTWPGKYENHAFEVHIEGGETIDTWDHGVHGDGDGDDAGLVFRYRWEPVRRDLRLFNRVDPILEAL